MAALGLMRKALTAQLNVLQAEIEEVRARRVRRPCAPSDLRPFSQPRLRPMNSTVSISTSAAAEGRITKLMSDIEDIRTELQTLRDRIDARGGVE